MTEKINKSLPEHHVLRVSKKTDPFALSTSIIGCIKDFGHCTIESVMERATFQSLKACILARQRLLEIDELEMDIEYEHHFIEPRPIIDGKPSTGIRIEVSLKNSKTKA